MDTFDVWLIPHERLAAYEDKILPFFRDGNFLPKKDSPLYWAALAKRYLLSHFTPDHPLSYGKNGKPYQKDCFFNLTNTKNASAIVTMDRECGLDMECERETTAEFREAVLGRNFPPPSKEEFLALWTRKEALSKAQGDGLSGAPLPDIPCQEGLCFYKGEAYYCRTIRYKEWTISAARKGKDPFALCCKEAI